MKLSASRPIVFLGPSMPLARARLTLPGADYRPPIQRGDLDDVAPGSVVGIIDGFFDRTLAISRGEIGDSIDAGVVVYGAASMGALRASEVPAVVGVGRVYEMYRSAEIERDDEVAVLVDPETHAALTEPLVNVRFAVERLVRTGTLGRTDGDAIISACAGLHYSERSYRAILGSSPLAGQADVDDIIKLLRTFDLKHDDAQLLLETLGTTKAPQRATRTPRGPAPSHPRAQAQEDASARVLIWESGDALAFDDLLLFLKITGRFEDVARAAVARMAGVGTELVDDAPPASPATTTAAQALLDAIRAQWGWEAPEEAHVTMRDLGLGLEDVADVLEAEATVRRRVAALGTQTPERFAKALRAGLWMHELSLKREALRAGALAFFAQEASAEPPSEQELDEAGRTIARLRGVMRWRAVTAGLAEIGVPPEALQAFTVQVARARRAALPITELLDGHTAARGDVDPRSERWRAFGLRSSPKAAGSARFSLHEAAAVHTADRIAEQMGVVRIGMVGELDTLGIYIAQAFGERSGWSSSFSSGKSETRDGARVGSIMEEVEIHAQDAYEPVERIRVAFADRDGSGLRLVDPLDLGLPYDSRYDPGVAIEWSPCLDLVSGETVHVPTAALVGDRQIDDPFYCPRLGGKIFSSSGLGSGFTMAEATLHAGAEYIERHALRLAELEIDNPGGVGLRSFWFVDEASLPETPARIVSRYRSAGMSVRILDMTSEVAVPTFYVRVFDDPFRAPDSLSSDGFACHPDPEVAVTMALLESAQTRGGFIAGGREDYSLRARSLGRHERPRTAVARSQLFWFGNDRPVRPLAATSGYVATDILDELGWLVDRVTAAGIDMFLVADYSVAPIAPAYAVRVLIPGLETTNPLFTGPRARATIIRDLLPRGHPRG